MMNIFQLKALTLPDAWFQLVYNIFEHGRIYTIDRGSYKGQKRLEYDYITCHIVSPGTRPLIPEIPEGMNIPAPTTEEYINQYMDYLLSKDVKKEGEVYTYAEYLVPQVEKVINMFKRDGYNTNQATITIGDKNSIDLDDPPCLRLIDCRISDNKLHFIIYFRSNDLWCGVPANLAGLQLVKEYMAEEIGVDDGEIIYSSKGLHLYDHVWDVAKCRINKQ